MNILEQQLRLKYSEIMENFQCIEYDLKRIYSAMSADDFDDNMDMLEFSNMGKTLRELEDMDNSDDAVASDEGVAKVAVNLQFLQTAAVQPTPEPEPDPGD